MSTLTGLFRRFRRGRHAAGRVIQVGMPGYEIPMRFRLDGDGRAMWDRLPQREDRAADAEFCANLRAVQNMMPGGFL